MPFTNIFSTDQEATYASEKKVDISTIFKQENYASARDWKRFFNIRVRDNIGSAFKKKAANKQLGSICPFLGGHNIVANTHLLCYLPGHINGKPITFASWTKEYCRNLNINPRCTMENYPWISDDVVRPGFWLLFEQSFFCHKNETSQAIWENGDLLPRDKGKEDALISSVAPGYIRPNLTELLLFHAIFWKKASPRLRNLGKGRVDTRDVGVTVSKLDHFAPFLTITRYGEEKLYSGLGHFMMTKLQA